VAMRSTRTATAEQHLTDQERLIAAIAVQQKPTQTSELYGQLAALIDVSPTSDDAQIREGMDKLAGIIPTASFAVLDLPSATLVAGSKAWDPALTVVTRSLVHANKKSAEVIFSDVVQTAHGPRTLLVVAASGWGSTRPRLVVEAQAPGPELLAPSLALVPGGGVLSVVDSKGVVVSSSDVAAAGHRLRGWDDMPRGGTGFSVRQKVSGVDTEVIGRPVPESSRFVVWSQPAKAFYRASTVGRTVGEFGTVALVGIAGGLVLISTHRRLSRSRKEQSKVTALLADTGDAVLVVRDAKVVQAWGSWQGNDWQQLLGSSVAGTLGDEVAEALARSSELGGKQRFDTAVTLPGGSEHWVEATVTDRWSDPAIRGLVVTLHDVSERNELQRTLSHQAAHDGLTGLANRQRFTSYANGVLAEQAETGGLTAVMYLDLNLFKLINDTFGHASGDEVLRVCADRLRACVRSVDAVARLGGDEFALLLPGTTTEVAELVGERVRAAITAPIQLSGGEPVAVGVSIGIAYSVDGSCDVESLLRDADMRMYTAKQGARRPALARIPHQPDHV
jgi:diguanylate cyclase (GGDEF)-like protein